MQAQQKEAVVRRKRQRPRTLNLCYVLLPKIPQPPCAWLPLTPQPPQLGEALERRGGIDRPGSLGALPKPVKKRLAECGWYCTRHLLRSLLCSLLERYDAHK